MSNRVRKVLEESVPELEDLFKKGIFTYEEIKKISERRERFEYLIGRHSCVKEDFLNYIQFEIHLDLLCIARQKKISKFLVSLFN